MVGPVRKREAVAHVCQRLEASERRACKTLGQPRSSQRYNAKPKEGDARLTAAIRLHRKPLCDWALLASEWLAIIYREIQYEHWRAPYRQLDETPINHLEPGSA